MPTTPFTWDNLPKLPDGWHWAVRDTCSGEILEDTIENNSVGGWVAGKPFDRPRFNKRNEWTTGKFVKVFTNGDNSFSCITGSTEEEFRVGNLVAIANGFKRDHFGDWS